MRKKVFILLSCFLVLSGCGSKQSVSKIDEALLNHFSSDYRSLLEEVNPDVVSMQYLVEHADDYATSHVSDRSDFFVIVSGKVTSIEYTEYGDEVLDYLDEDMASLLIGTTTTTFYLDDCDTPMDDTGSEFSLEADHQYYFFVHVTEITADNYMFTPFECFDFE